jgi:5S rRNA maturation endonuclease (ribonuclease M5)
VICARIESRKRCGEAGWLHRLRDDGRHRPQQRRVNLSLSASAVSIIDFGAMAAQYEQALGPHQRELLAAELGVTTGSLSRLQVGWSECDRSYTFPMRDRAEDGVACGIRLRRPDGFKWAVKGSKQGLFIPRKFPVGDTLLICEGPTDTAALLMLCFDAVGRPSCNGGLGLVVDLVQRHHFSDVVIIADRDQPGQRGARYLASRLVGYVPNGVRVVTPPAKDAREWVQQGANRLDVLDAIEAAPTMALTYSGRTIR